MRACSHARTDGQTGAHADGWTDGRTHRSTDARKRGRTDAHPHTCTHMHTCTHACGDTGTPHMHARAQARTYARIHSRVPAHSTAWQSIPGRPTLTALPPSRTHTHARQAHKQACALCDRSCGRARQIRPVRACMHACVYPRACTCVRACVRGVKSRPSSYQNTQLLELPMCRAHRQVPMCGP